jgi:predicted RNase H-like nuclease (RuvC/YqgF family)
MKKIILGSFILAAAALTGCENYKDELAQMTTSRDSLVAVSNDKDRSLEEFIASIDEIESNLSEITERSQIVKKTTPAENSEMNKSSKERIQSEIAAISQLVDESKAKTEELTKKLKNSNFKVGKLEKMVATLNEQIATKETELVALNEQLTALNTKVETLNGEVTVLSSKDSVNTSIIENQTNKMNTAYIAIGDYKKLRDDQVVTKEGGFLGLGKEEKMSPTVNTEAFSKVDITKISNIPLDTKDAKLVTTHPNGSYTIEKQNDKVSEIVITDSEKFWSASKYLVVMTK